MAKFCKMCGKQLGDNEVCNCAGSAQQVAPQAQPQPQQPQQFVNQNVQNQGFQGQPQPQPQQQWQAQPQQQWQGQPQPGFQGQQQWQGQPGFQGQPMAAPKPSAFGNAFKELGVLLKVFFTNPVKGVVEQMRKNSIVLAIIIMSASILIRAIASLINSLITIRSIDIWGYTFKTVGAGVHIGNFFRGFFDTALFFGILATGLFLFTKVFYKTNTDYVKALTAVGCASVLLPAADLLSFIPYFGPLVFSSVRFLSIIAAVFAVKSHEEIQDSDKMVYVASITMAGYYLINLLLTLIFGASILSM